MAQVRTRKRGKTYSYIFEAGQVNGKRKVIEKGGFPTKDAAYEAGVEAFTSWKHGNIGITSERVSLSDFARLWMGSVAVNTKDSTRVNYQTILKNRIEPYIGRLLVQDITPADLDTWIAKLYGEGYSKGYITSCRMVVKSMLDYAVYPGNLIKSNPCIYIKVPKKAPTKIVKRVIVSDERYHDLMRAYPVGHDMRIPIAIFWHTGLRIGEVLGLTWQDIDLENQSLTVGKQKVYAQDGPTHNRISDTKTKASHRKIYITDELTRELRAEKRRQETITRNVVNVVDQNGYCFTCSREFADSNLEPIDLVCITAKGRPVNRTILSNVLRKEGLNSHSFRHTQATRLAKAKVPPVTAARRLGHANVDTTLNLYTHDTEDMQREAMELLQERG